MNTPSPSHHHDAPTLESLQRAAHVELSQASRWGYVALLLTALVMSAILVSLWATEPALPARTHLAFAVMTSIGIAWATFATWVLRQRRVLFARHRVIAGWMAVTFSGMFLMGAGWATLSSLKPAAVVALVSALVMFAGALWVLRSARMHVQVLSRRRETLARELRDLGGEPPG